MIIHTFPEVSYTLKQKAESACLLHDIWKYNYSEQNLSFDHWDAGSKILLEAGFDIDVALSVKYHNKYCSAWFYQEYSYMESSEQIKKEMEFLMKINKDAWELANIADLIFGGKIHGNFDWLELSPLVRKQILERKLVHNKTVMNNLDFIFMRLSGLFDIHYPITKEVLWQLWYENIIKKSLVDTLGNRYQDVEDIYKVLWA